MLKKIMSRIALILSDEMLLAKTIWDIITCIFGLWLILILAKAMHILLAILIGATISTIINILGQVIMQVKPKERQAAEGT